MQFGSGVESGGGGPGGGLILIRQVLNRQSAARVNGAGRTHYILSFMVVGDSALEIRTTGSPEHQI